MSDYKGKSNYKDFKTKGDSGSGNLPQYGKKGHKPRIRDERSAINLDDIRTNDISYWNKSEGFDRVTKFNWDLIVGRPRNVDGLFHGTGTTTLSGKLNPAQVMVLDFCLGPGYAVNINDGVNRGLAMLMAKIRATLSTSQIGFETADLGIFLASTSSITCLIGFAKRVLECYTVWKDRNYVYPRALIKAQGFDYADIRDNINQYAAKLNAYIDQYNNMSIIDTFDLYDRQYSMSHNVFVDEDSDLGQLYMFKPKNYYLYDDTSTPNKAVSTVLSYTDFNDLLTVIDSAIQRWYSSSDLYQINGVLLRAFKDAPRQVVPYYKLEDVIQPVVDRAFLMQIMNCTIVGDLTNSSLDITQDPTTQNYIIWRPLSSKTTPQLSWVPAAGDYQMLRLFESDISQDDNMELTRLVNFTNWNTKYIDNCGSEIITGIRMYVYDTSTDAFSVSITLDANSIVVSHPNLPVPQTMSMLQQLMLIQPFRYIPTIHVLLNDTTANTAQYLGVLGDTYNWMIYPREDYATLQFVAYQSLWSLKNL